MTTTPRTYEAASRIDWEGGDYSGYVLMMQFARQLERELEKARDTIAALYAGTIKLERELASTREALASLNKPKPTEP